jgi:hypothetical protein
MRDVTLKITGLERTAIEVGSDEDSFTYRSYNYIIQLEKVLVGAGEIQPGEHGSNFTFKLPTDAIPTYNGFHSKISYLIRAQVDIPFWFDLKTQKTFWVLYGLETIMSWAKPVSFATTNYQTDDSLFVSNNGFFGPKKVKPSFLIELDKDTFLAGEALTGRITIKNKLQKTIRKVKLLLRAKEYAWAQGYSRYRTVEKHKFKIEMDNIIEGVPSPFSIAIPPRVRTGFNGMYSRVDWFLEAQLDIAFAFDIKAKQQIRIYHYCP